MGIFASGRIKNKITPGKLSGSWSNAKKGKKLKLPKEDFGIKLNNFEGYVKKANAISAEIDKLFGELVKAKKKCKDYADLALNTAEFYQKKVPANETGVVGTLNKIIEDIKADTQKVSVLTTTRKGAAKKTPEGPKTCGVC